MGFVKNIKLDFDMSVMIKEWQHEGDDVSLDIWSRRLENSRWGVEMFAAINMSRTSERP